MLHYDDLMDEILAKAKSFSAKEYYDEVQRMFPNGELNKKWYQRMLSEEQIEGYVREWYKGAPISGKESVPEAEQILGIEIGGKYIFPNGMSDEEYHKHIVLQDGLINNFQKGDGRDFAYVDGKIDKKRAYIQAWRNLQYDRREVLKNKQEEWQKLCELNPQLNEVVFDKNNMGAMVEAIAGVYYDFPHKDINYFVNRGEGNFAANSQKRILQECKEAGLPSDFRFHWVPCSETIKEVGQKYLYKQQRQENYEKSQAVNGQTENIQAEIDNERKDKSNPKISINKFLLAMKAKLR